MFEINEEQNNTIDFNDKTETFSICLPCTKIVNFCCVNKIPEFITADLSTDADEPRLTYDPKCLSCSVEPCEFPIECDDERTTLEIFSIKIVGCMQYQIETRYEEFIDICADPDFVDRIYSNVCVGVARFNNAICYGSKCEMKNVCRQINAKLRGSDRCNLIQICEKDATIKNCPNSGGRYVEFTGKFKIDYDC